MRYATKFWDIPLGIHLNGAGVNNNCVNPLGSLVLLTLLLAGGLIQPVESSVVQIYPAGSNMVWIWSGGVKQ